MIVWIAIVLLGIFAVMFLMAVIAVIAAALISGDEHGSSHE